MSVDSANISLSSTDSDVWEVREMSSKSLAFLILLGLVSVFATIAFHQEILDAAAEAILSRGQAAEGVVDSRSGSSRRASSSADRPSRFPVRYAQVTSPTGALVRDQPSQQGVRIQGLRQGAIVKVTNKRGQRWFKVTTRLGDVGWSRTRQFEFLAWDQAEKRIRRDETVFEERVYRLIEEEARKKVIQRHPASEMGDFLIVTPLERRSSHAYQVDACALARGKLLGINKFRVDLRLKLFMELDPSELGNSVVRVRRVEVLSDEQTEGLGGIESVGLLAKLLPGM